MSDTTSWPAMIDLPHGCPARQALRLDERVAPALRHAAGDRRCRVGVVPHGSHRTVVLVLGPAALPPPPIAGVELIVLREPAGTTVHCWLDHGVIVLALHAPASAEPAPAPAPAKPVPAAWRMRAARWLLHAAACLIGERP